MSPFKSHFDSSRRDILRYSPLALAAAVPAVAAVGQTASPGQGIIPSGLHSHASFFDIRNFGAIPDGKSLNSHVFNAAIAAAAAMGGGTVYVPAGVWHSFSIRMKSHVHLYLAQGSTIIAADSPLPHEQTGYHGGVYDAAEGTADADHYQDYGHSHWHNSLIWGEDIHDISITGPGLIYGKGLSNGRDWVQEVVPFKAEQPGVGNKTISFKNCRNVTLRDFSILKGGHFGLLLTGVDNVTVDNLLIDTDRDGMDFDCCRNVHVSNCTVNSPWDDAICPKSSLALRYPRSTENVTITNCYVTGCYEIGSVLNGTWKKFPADMKMYRTGRIKCGTESNGGFKNITISNCVFEGCQGLALESEDGALCEDITISNITMRDNVSAPLFFRLGARLRGPKESTQVGALRRISVNNLVSSNGAANICSILSGIPSHSLEDIHLSNIFIEHKGGAPAEAAAIRPPEKETAYPDPDMFGPMPAQGFFLRHILNLEMSHIEVRPQQPDFRPSFYLDEVTRADMLAITAPNSPQLRAFHLNKVADLRIAISRAARDTQISTAESQSL